MIPIRQIQSPRDDGHYWAHGADDWGSASGNTPEWTVLQIHRGHVLRMGWDVDDDLSEIIKDTPNLMLVKIEPPPAPPPPAVQA